MRHIHNAEMTRPAFESPQTWGKECANSVSHGLGLLAALGAAPVLIVAASGQKVASLVGAAVFAATMVLLYFTSMLYHALPPGRAKRAFLQLDYCAIFLFLAGGYTPFALGALRGRLSHPWASTGLYLAMGWLVLIAAVPLVESLQAQHSTKATTNQQVRIRRSTTAQTIAHNNLRATQACQVNIGG